MLREIASTELYTVLLVICLLLIATTKILFSKRFEDFVSVLFNYRYLKVYARAHKFFDIFESILFANFVIGLSILAIISYKMNPNLEVSQHSGFFKLTLAIAIILISKTLIERLINSVLNIDNFLSDYIFLKTSYKNFLGLVLIPINALLIFTLDLSQWIILFFVILLLLINCIGIFFFIKDNLTTIKSNLFYFILYLCALEISPYFILYKLITKLGG